MTGCSNPVFIGGCHRSGTTALWNALAQHPNLHPASGRYLEKELWFFVEFFAGRSGYPLYRLHELDRMFLCEAIRFINEFMTRHTASATNRYITAHPNNLFHFKQIINCLPTAKLLILVRHPQEVTWSMLNAPSASAAGWRLSRQTDPITTEDITNAATLWKRSAQVVLEALGGVFGDSALVVRHEELVSKPSQIMRQILDFVEEPFDPVVVEALKQGIFNSSFAPESRMTRFKDETERQAFFARRVAEIAEHQSFCAVVSAVAGEEMHLLGYEDYAASSKSLLANHTLVTNSQGRAAEIVSASIVGPDGKPRDGFPPGAEMALRVLVRANQPVHNLSISFRVRDGDVHLCGTTTFDERSPLPDLNPGEKLEVMFRFSQVLRAGRYQVDVCANSVSSPIYSDNVEHHLLMDACEFESLRSPSRPIHYKFDNPVKIQFAGRVE